MERVAHERFLVVLQVSCVQFYLIYPLVLGSLLDAMSVDCAIVASDTAPVRETIIDRENVVRSIFNPLVLAGKVDQLLNDLQMREIFSRTARETIVENYDLRTHFLPQAIA